MTTQLVDFSTEGSERSRGTTRSWLAETRRGVVKTNLKNTPRLLSCLLALLFLQRAPGSLSWAGILNTQFWIDPANGIGGILLMQHLPFYDEDAIETLTGFESLVYAGLSR